jgi:hypothetical protein
MGNFDPSWYCTTKYVLKISKRVIKNEIGRMAEQYGSATPSVLFDGVGQLPGKQKQAQGKTLLKFQKRFVGLIAGKGGRYHLPSMGSSRWGTYIGSS